MPKPKSETTGRPAMQERPEAKKSVPPRDSVVSAMPTRDTPEADAFESATAHRLQPDTRVAPREVEAAGIWQENKRVVALWGANESRNSWVLIDGAGWKKLSTSSDSATLALTVLASNGKLTRTRVDYREEADGLIHELYVW